MSDHPAFDLGAATGSSLGGNRIPGQRSDQSQTKRDAAIKATMEKWGVKEYVDIFPLAIRPQGDLGDCAIFNLRYIANKVPDLDAARLLMTQECIDSASRPTKLSFKNTSNILAHLKSIEAKAAADEKDKEKKDKKVKVPASERSAASTEHSTMEHRLAAAMVSVPTRDSAGTKVSAGFKSSFQTNNLTTAKNLASGNHSALGETLVPAKNLLVGKTSSLSKVKAPISRLQPSNIGMPSSKFASHVSLMRGNANNKEFASGLHVPSAKDVAPFSSNKRSTSKKSSSKKRVSFALENESDNKTTRNLFPTEEQHSSEPRSGVPRLMTDKNDGPGDVKSQSNASAKRTSDGGEEPLLKKPKFDKESILGELNFKKRATSKNDGNITTGQTPSEADTEIDTESVLSLLSDNVAIKYGFKDVDDKNANDEGAKEILRDEIAASDMMSGRSVEKEKRKRITPVRRAWATAPGSTSTNAVADPNMSAATKQQVEKKMASQDTPKVGKIPSSCLESPISPKNSPDREESIHSSAARRLFELHNSKRTKITNTFSPSGELPKNHSMSPENKSPNFSAKTDQESSMPKKDIMDYNVSEVVDQAKERSAKSTTAGDPQLTPKALVTPAKGTSAIPRKPNSMLPELPETLTARIPADRALITSVPGIIKAYINELRAAIPDGKGPDGDLLSMIIVNKYGYFLEHVEQLDKDLISLYYEALDRNP